MELNMPEAIAIVGANLAGGRAAAALRQNGFEGRIALIGEERWLPYERPPLSKEVLWDNGKLPESFFLQDEAWYSENRIDLHLGLRAERLDLAGGDRNSVVEGKSVSVRVDLGGRRIIKKKTQTQIK